MYIITGQNEYLIKEYISKIINTNSSSDKKLSIVKYNLNEIDDLNQLKLNILNYNIFSIDNIYLIYIDIVNDKINLFLNEINQDSINDNIVLIVAKSEIKKINKSIIKVNKFLDFNNLSNFELINWIKDYVAKHNGQINNQEIKFLIEHVSTNQLELYHEINKLLLFNKKISIQDIKELCFDNYQYTSFNLIDEVFQGNLQESLIILKNLISKGLVIPEILSLFAWYFMVLELLITNNQKMTNNNLANLSNISYSVLNRNQNIVKKINISQFKKIIDQIINIDYMSKNIKIDLKQAFEVLLLEINFYLF